MNMCMLICMCMLTKRTNILFDESQWMLLSLESKKRNISIGKLVRQAVDNTYVSKEKTDRMRRAYDRIMQIRPKPVKGRIDYKELINHGRKY